VILGLAPDKISSAGRLKEGDAPMLFPSRRFAFSIALLIAMPAGALQAQDVAYYRFEDTFTSDVNSPDLDATAGSTAGFSTDRPGTMIDDQITLRTAKAAVLVPLRPSASLASSMTRLPADHSPSKRL